MLGRIPSVKLCRMLQAFDFVEFLSSRLLLLQYHSVLLAAAFCSWYVLIFHPVSPKSTVLQKKSVQLSPSKTIKIFWGRKT